MSIAHIATLGLAALSATVASASSVESVVRAPAGAVRGTLVDGQHIFKGIPYALPPIGERRWQPPAPMPDWSDVRDATRFGPACQQPSAPAGSIYAETYPAMSEDCLSLNIWTPAESKNAPVFVWIHGGNLIRGSSQQAMFDGANLARRGVVVVSITSRGVRLLRASRTERRIARRRVGQLRPARSDRRPELGEKKHQCVRRRRRECHDRRRIGGRTRHSAFAGCAACAWPPHNKEAAYMIFADKPRVAADLMPGQYELHEQVVCRRRAAGNIPWNWNVGVTAPPLPPATETCR